MSWRFATDVSPMLERGAAMLYAGTAAVKHFRALEVRVLWDDACSVVLVRNLAPADGENVLCLSRVTKKWRNSVMNTYYNKGIPISICKWHFYDALMTGLL